jgi:hypothetical protein
VCSDDGKSPIRAHHRRAIAHDQLVGESQEASPDSFFIILLEKIPFESPLNEGKSHPEGLSGRAFRWYQLNMIPEVVPLDGLRKSLTEEERYESQIRGWPNRVLVLFF